MIDSEIISKRTPKEVLLELGKKCDKCGNCCTYGSGCLLPEEIASIAAWLGMQESEFKERYVNEISKFNAPISKLKVIKSSGGKGYGRCIFYDAKIRACKINTEKPLYCRIATCAERSGDFIQWFDLNYVIDMEDPESIRQWNSFLLLNEPIPGGRIEEIVPEPELRRKILSYEIFSREELRKFREQSRNNAKEYGKNQADYGEK